MYQGKHTRTPQPKKRRRLRWGKEFLTLCSVLVLLIGIVGGTLAYLVTKTDPVENTFTPANSGIDIPEDFKDGETVKKNVRVKNDSDYSVYVRTTYVYYWADEQGNVLGEVPNLTTANINEADWTKHGDYWYCNTAVESKKETPVFIKEMKADPKSGYRLVVDVIAETVQAEPIQAAQEVWGFVPTVSGN